MNLPLADDFIDIHNHGASSATGIFSVENITADEERVPDDSHGLAYTIGIHPWHVTVKNYNEQLKKVILYSRHSNVIALGEAGFDRLRGPEINFQKEIFEKQVIISEEVKKPLYIHCVKAWEELLSAHKMLKPHMPWLVHGFRGKHELALQLITRGMYISLWFDFVMRPESTQLLKSLPFNRIFLETDGGDTKISTIYEKVATDLDLTVDQLKSQLYSNFRTFFGV